MSNGHIPRYLYWDTCVFIDFFTAAPDRIDTLNDIMREIQANSLATIYTSILTITEVSHLEAEKTQEKLDDTILRRLDTLWDDRSLITIIELNRSVANIARDLRRQAVAKQWSLQPADAIQLATAYWLKQHVRRPVDEVHTYDKRIQKFDTMIDIPILEPYARQSSLPGI